MLDTSTAIGIGISGSSVSNMIMQNTAYNNPFNYTFVTNVFNPLLSQMPSALQNIALEGCESIALAENVGLLTQQNQDKLIDVESKVCVIQSEIDQIRIKENVFTFLLQSIIDLLTP